MVHPGQGSAQQRGCSELGGLSVHLLLLHPCRTISEHGCCQALVLELGDSTEDSQGLSSPSCGKAPQTNKHVNETLSATIPGRADIRERGGVAGRGRGASLGCGLRQGGNIRL